MQPALETAGVFAGILVLGSSLIPGAYTGNRSANHRFGPGAGETTADGRPSSEQTEGTVAGRVYGPNGAPVVGAQVSVIGSRVWPAKSIDTDAEGRFAWEDIPPGIYEVRARRDNWIAPPLEGLELEAGRTRVVSFRLLPGRILHGRVVDRDQSTPIRAASVSVGEGSIGLSSRTTQTDRDGRFTFDGILDTDLRVAAVADGYVASPPRMHRPSDGEVVLTLSKAARVEGEVVDAGGHPVVGARVVVVLKHAGSPRPALAADSLGVTAGVVPPISAAGSAPSESGHAMTSVQASTDTRGAFVLEGLGAGRIQLVASHPDYAPGQSSPLTLRGGAVLREVRITLERGGLIDGRVVDARGFGLGAVSVELREQDGALPRLTMSSDDGTFEFQGVRDDVTLIARTANQLSVRKRAKVTPGERVSVTLQIAAALTELRGRMVDDRGFGVERVQVTVTSFAQESPSKRTTFSEGDGTFVFSSLPEPPYRLIASHPEFSVARIERVSSVDDELVVTLTSSAWVQGRVIDDWTGDGVSDAKLVLVGASPSETRSDGDGIFRIDQVPAGTYALEVHHPDYDVYKSEVTVDVSSRSTGGLVLDALRLPPTGQIEGEVVDAAGDPVLDAEVAWGAQPQWSRKATTNGEGVFVLRGVPPGKQPVTARHARAGVAQFSGLVSVRAQDLSRGVVIRLPRAKDAEPVPQDAVVDQ